MASDQLASFNIPTAPLDPTTSDKAWNLMQNQVKQLTERFLLLSKNSLRINGFFLGLITFSPDDGVDDFTDARYYVNFCQAGIIAANLQLVVGQASSRNAGLIPQYVIATNLAEIYPQQTTSGNPVTGGPGTHLLADNTPVIVYVFSDPAIPTNNYYVFNLMPYTGLVFQLQAVATKPGTYAVKIFNAPTTATFDPTGSSNLSASDFGSAGPDAWAINTREVGVAGHILDTTMFLPQLFTGILIGSANDGVPLIAFNSDQSEACN